jgi:hypothetical protein
MEERLTRIFHECGSHGSSKGRIVIIVDDICQILEIGCAGEHAVQGNPQVCLAQPVNR